MSLSEICSGSEAGSYLRLIDACITQLRAQGTSRTCNESKEEEDIRHLVTQIAAVDRRWHISDIQGLGFQVKVPKKNEVVLFARKRSDERVRP